MHAFVHGLFRPSDKTETRELYERVKSLIRGVGLNPETAQAEVASRTAKRAAVALGLEADHPQSQVMKQLAFNLLSAEGRFALSEIDWCERRSVWVPSHSVFCLFIL